MQAADILAIQQLHARYGQFVDDRRFEDIAALFCEDGVWEAGPLRFSGHAEIIAGFEQIEPPEPQMVKHLTFTPIIEGQGDDAHSWADAIALTVGEPDEPCPVVATGRYHDVLRREQGQWRFVRRVFVYARATLPEGLGQAPTPV